MISFLFCIGLINVGLGLGCGIWLQRERIKIAAAALTTTQPVITTPAPKAEVASKSPPSKSSPATTQNTPAKAQPVEATSASAAAHTWSAPKTWDDFGSQLLTLNNRIAIARSANDLRLAKDIVAQLLSCIQFWSVPLKQELEQLEKDAKTCDEPAKYEAEINKKELCLAQLETSLANLKAIVWDGDPAEILDQLDREASLLDKNQRLASPPGAGHTNL